MDFRLVFFQRFWDVVAEDVWVVAEEFRRKKAIFKAWNSTYLALIPKNTAPNFFDEMRPITLCNGIYKIVSKAMATRLKKCLEGFILEEQSGFLKGR